jgi:hypothetical protein
MEFTVSSILLALFSGVVAGIACYFASYAKVRGELRAATEDMRQSLANLALTTRTVETEKARIAADALLESDKRKTVYALAIATQSLIHSMCWLAWDASTRREVRKTASDLYNAEAHKLLPELFSQLAVLRLIDPELHGRAFKQATELVLLDGKFGEAIVLSETDSLGAARRLSTLYDTANEMQFRITGLFDGETLADERRAAELTVVAHRL